MSGRIVAELGRPETPEETAARKAEASRVHRASRTFGGLIAALIATLAVVLVVIAGVPRGELAGTDDIDVAAVAQGFSEAYGRPVITPIVPESWTVNSAALEGDDVAAFTIVYVPDGPGFLRVAQAFGPDPSWVSRTLSGATSDGTVTIDGIVWDRYEIGDPSRAQNISYALATAAGPDVVLLYGSAGADTTSLAAAGLAEQIRTLRATTPREGTS